MQHINEVTCTCTSSTSCLIAEISWLVIVGVLCPCFGACFGAQVIEKWSRGDEPWPWLPRHHMMLEGPNTRDQTTGWI